MTGHIVVSPNDSPLRTCNFCANTGAVRLNSTHEFRTLTVMLCQRCLDIIRMGEKVVASAPAKDVVKDSGYADFQVRVSATRVATIEELHAAFNRVTAGMANWKDPIDVVLEMEPSDTALAGNVLLICKAITFHTASIPTIEAVERFKYRFRAPGYYVSCGA